MTKPARKRPDHWPANELPLQLTVDDMAFWLNVPRSALKGMVDCGMIPPPERIGRRDLWYRPKVQAALDRRHGIGPAAADRFEADRQRLRERLRAS